MRALLFIIVVIVCTCCCTPGSCQDFPMLHFNTGNGLPSNKIYSIYKDHNGFVWIATDKGVVRYNGARFEIFSTFNGLPDNEIFFFQEDNYRRLWLATYNGDLCYYKNDTFHTALNTPFLRTGFKPRSYISCIYPEFDSSVTFFFNSEYNFVSVKDQYLRVEYLDNLYKERQIFIFGQKTGKNTYSIVCSQSETKVDTNANVLSIQPRNFDKSYFLQTNNQHYLINGLSFYNFEHPEDTIRIPETKHGSNRISCIYFNGKKYFVLTTDALCYNGDQRLFFGATSTIGTDNKGNYWIGTLNRGIFVLDSNFEKTKFRGKAYRGNVKFSHSIEGKTYFSTDSALYCYDSGSITTVVRYKRHDGEPVMLINENGNFFYFSFGSRVFIENINAARRKITFNHGRDVGYKRLMWINDKLYVHHRNGIMVDGKDGLRPLTSQNSRVYYMAGNNDGTIWFSTRNNLYKIHKDDAIDTLPFRAGLRNFDFIGGCMAGITHNNTFLLCSNLNGKFLTDTIPAQDCIWEKFYKLDDKHMLISTNKLYRLLTVDPAGTGKKYDIRILEDPFIPLQAESFCSDGKNFYFFKDESITVIDKGRFFAIPRPPQLHYELLKTAKRSYLMKEALTIPFYESKNLVISFSTLSFSDKHITWQYSFTRAGVDNWQELQQETININNPGYGTYILKVRARTLSSDYSTPVIFNLEIKRPFWSTWWFLIIVLVGLVLFILFLARWLAGFVIRKKEREHNAQVRFIKSEYKALNALMNPHFIFNTLNNLQSLFNADGDKRQANKYLRVFANLIRQNMHNVAKEEIPLRKEIDLVTNYLLLEKMRFEDRLEYSIDIEQGLDMAMIMVPPLLVQPLVENSIKHGILSTARGQGVIQLNIFELDSILFIEVKNTGRGTAGRSTPVLADDAVANDPHEPFGLDNIRMRIEQLSIIQGKKITLAITNTQDEAERPWTTVTITIPLN